MGDRQQNVAHGREGSAAGNPASSLKRGVSHGGNREQALTASIADSLSHTRESQPVRRRRRTAPGKAGGECLQALDSLLLGRFPESDAARAVLDAARRRALHAWRTAEETDAADRLAASLFAGEAIVGLAVEQILDPTHVRDTAIQLAAQTTDGSVDAAQLDLFLRAVSHPLLADLPPLFAVETQLRLLPCFGLVSEVSLWIRSRPGRVDCAIQLGEEEPSRRTRTIAKLTLSGGPAASIARRAQIHSVLVHRWGRPAAAIVARINPETRSAAQAYLAETGAALSTLLERAALLERSSERERTLTTGSERRLTRLGFDLHDGPIQDVIAVAGELRHLRNDIYPFIADSEREQADRRFDELAERLTELDGDLRELAHSLESRSAVSRPIEEVLHREVDGFIARTGIKSRLRIDGNCSFLTVSQRITLFRAVQEALSNAREHSGATAVEVRLRCRRTWTELKIWDNGRGFQVEHGLAHAAKRGRLGIVGISERVRMLGGTFELESAPGGPTRLSLSLPRWEPLDPASERY